MTIPFPLNLTYRKNCDFEYFDSEQITLLTDLLELKKVIITKTTKSQMEFDVPFFRLVGNWNIMGYVDKGQIKIESQAGKNEIIYKVSFFRFILIGILLSVFVSFASDSIIFFLIVLTLFVGVSWIIGWFKQKFYFEKILKELKNVLHVV